jgi:hypothetical protein
MFLIRFLLGVLAVLALFIFAGIGYLVCRVIVLFCELWDIIRERFKPRPPDMQQVSPGWNSQMGYHEHD